jgi:hypothetical protein
MIKLKNLLNEETFTAVKKVTGNTSIFKSKETRDAAIKAGTHTTHKDVSKQSTDKPILTKSSVKFPNGSRYSKGSKLKWKGEMLKVVDIQEDDGHVLVTFEDTDGYWKDAEFNPQGKLIKPGSLKAKWY